jgi:(2Fe-2S) ferredoxin
MKPHSLEFHLFICTHERPENHPTGSCAQKGSQQFLDAFKAKIKEAQPLNSGTTPITLRVQKAGCLDVCKQGIAMVIYPQGIWYGRLQISDIDEIINTHLKTHLKPSDSQTTPQIIERLLITSSTSP